MSILQDPEDPANQSCWEADVQICVNVVVKLCSFYSPSDWEFLEDAKDQLKKSLPDSFEITDEKVIHVYPPS